MCAIAGILNLKMTEDTIEKMHRTMRRRGPDAKGVFRDADVTLLHARLAVIDPMGGQQPMTFSFGGEEYTIVRQNDILAVVE